MSRARTPREPFKLKTGMSSNEMADEFQKEIVEVFAERDALALENQVLINVVTVLVKELGGEATLVDDEVSDPPYNLGASQSIPVGWTIFRVFPKQRGTS